MKKTIFLALTMVLQSSMGLANDEDVPINPELVFEDAQDLDAAVAIAQPTEKENPNKLTKWEKAALEKWVKQCDEHEEEVATSCTPQPKKDQEKEECVAQGPRKALKEYAAQNPMKANSSIESIHNNGQFIILDDSSSYKVPVFLRKKVASWSDGDLIHIEKAEREGWFKISNITANDAVVAKLERAASEQTGTEKAE